MKSISFDNPYLLLIFIPLVLLVVIPYVIAIKKTNRALAPKISLALHIVICALITLALAGMSTTTIMTKTEVYIVADVSHSSSNNLDTIDEYIEYALTKLPKNSKVGIVCFAKDRVVLTEMGGDVKSVKEAVLDKSATDISGALDFTRDLFSEDVIKKILLITDGKQTDNDAAVKLINSIEGLYREDISIDAVYLDNNLSEGVNEVQLSGVDFTKSTYLGKASTANVLVQSSFDTQAVLTLTVDGNVLSERAVTLTVGYNVINFPLPTDVEGVFDYEVSITADSDSSALNNSYAFTQEITGKVKVLLVSDVPSDLAKVSELYGTGAEITSFIKNPNVPSSVEALCEYDEIVISSVDVRSLNNVSAFLDSLQKAVFNFGKSLITIGDLSLQNKTSDDLATFEDMLPVSYGNNDTDPKLYTLIIDGSRSMQMASRLIMTKEAAIQLIDIIQPTDHVAIISFSGDVTVMQAPVPASNKNALVDMINSIEPSQGTFIGKSLVVAKELMKDLPYKNKQVMLISDGMSYSLESDDPVSVARELMLSGIRVSTINPRSNEGAATLAQIAQSGGGKCYEIENEEKIKEFIYDQIADDITETVINASTSVRIDKPTNSLVSALPSLPNVLGFVYSKQKPTATTVLSVKYPGKDVYSPLYSTWNYGEGKVSSFTSTISGEWARVWNDNEYAGTFLTNVTASMTPEERVDYPFSLDVRYDGIKASVELIPAMLDPTAVATLLVTHPDGSTESIKLSFDSSRYFSEFLTSSVGKYTLDITYTYKSGEFTSSTVIDIPYSPEYDSFALFDSSSLFSAIRDRGTVSEGEVPELTNDPKRLATYTVSFVIPFMITAAVLYVADIIIRKLKWRDIVTLVKKIQARGGKAA